MRHAHIWINVCMSAWEREYQEFVLYIVCLVIGYLLSLLSAFMCVCVCVYDEGCCFGFQANDLAQHGWSERSISPLEITGFQLHIWRNFNIYFHRFCERRIVTDLSPSSASRNTRREFSFNQFSQLEVEWKSVPSSSEWRPLSQSMNKFSIVRLRPQLIIIYKF